jgi:hypothetical protein
MCVRSNNIPTILWLLSQYIAHSTRLFEGRFSLGSRDKPTQNADGSTDIYLEPKAPQGKEGNWLATVPGKGYFAILRFYGPTEEALNKSWKPGDIEKMK